MLPGTLLVGSVQLNIIYSSIRHLFLNLEHLLGSTGIHVVTVLPVIECVRPDCILYINCVIQDSKRSKLMLYWLNVATLPVACRCHPDLNPIELMRDNLCSRLDEKLVG